MARRRRRAERPVRWDDIEAQISGSSFATDDSREELEKISSVFAAFWRFRNAIAVFLESKTRKSRISFATVRDDENAVGATQKRRRQSTTMTR
jgi:hypothetical protein